MSNDLVDPVILPDQHHLWAHVEAGKQHGSLAFYVYQVPDEEWENNKHRSCRNPICAWHFGKSNGSVSDLSCTLVILFMLTTMNNRPGRAAGNPSMPKGASGS
jgi:hypothetical protein